MTSWLSGGLKSSFSNLKDQVTNSVKDVLAELEEDETDTDLLDENSLENAIAGSQYVVHVASPVIIQDITDAEN